MFSDCDAVLLLHNEKNPGMNLKYLSGYDGDFGIGFFFAHRNPKVFISSLEELPTDKSIQYGHIDKPGLIKQTVKKHRISTLGLSYDEISKHTYDTLRKQLRGVSFVDVSEQLCKRRMIKTRKEVSYLTRAISITERLLAEVIDQLRTAKYEQDIITYLRKRMIEEGVEPSFPPIIASGRHSKNPHYQPGPRAKVLEGFCIIDMGVKYRGYCADLSRTVYIGKISERDRQRYERVREALQRIESGLKAGTEGIEVGFEMVHALGHGIGRDVHERPFVGHDRLKAGMTVAVEPAQYFSDGGVRIEDNYLIQKNDARRLSKSSRKLRCITRAL